MEDEHIGSELFICLYVCHPARFDCLNSEVPQDSLKRLAFHAEMRSEASTEAQYIERNERGHSERRKMARISEYNYFCLTVRKNIQIE